MTSSELMRQAWRVSPPVIQSLESGRLQSKEYSSSLVSLWYMTAEDGLERDAKGCVCVPPPAPTAPATSRHGICDCIKVAQSPTNDVYCNPKLRCAAQGRARHTTAPLM